VVAVAVNRHTRAAVQAFRAVLEPLGVSVEICRHSGKHLIVTATAPDGRHANVSIAGTPRNTGHQVNNVRQEARRHAQAWGLLK
jgi:hypothetical protein